MLMNYINAFNLINLSVILIFFSRYCYKTLHSYELSKIKIDTLEYVCAYLLYLYTGLIIIFTGYFISTLL